jgi:hypothetical protein
MRFLIAQKLWGTLGNGGGENSGSLFDVVHENANGPGFLVRALLAVSDVAFHHESIDLDAHVIPHGDWLVHKELHTRPGDFHDPASDRLLTAVHVCLDHAAVAGKAHLAPAIVPFGCRRMF